MLPQEQYNEYLRTITSLKKYYKTQIEIYNGLELDYIPSLHTTVTNRFKPHLLDYTIGSIHFIEIFSDGSLCCIDSDTESLSKGLSEIFNNNNSHVIQKYFTYTRQMIDQMRPSIVGHFDKLKMQNQSATFLTESNPIYRNEVLQTLDCTAKTNCIIEVNSQGAYKRNEPEFYPSN